MFLFLKGIAHHLILPPGICLVLMLIGIVLIAVRRRWGWPVFLSGFLTLWLFCTPIIADGLTAWVERYPALDPNHPVNAQAIVVLGGGSIRDRAPEYGWQPMAADVLIDRLALAAYLSRKFSLPIEVSGATREAMAMSETLSRNFGVTPRWYEGNSRDTFQNARLSAHILLPAGIRRIVLVTSSSHEWRAAHEFMDAGFDVIPAPAGVLTTREWGVYRFLPSPEALERSFQAVYELVGEPMRQVQKRLGNRERGLAPLLEREVPPAVPEPTAAPAPTAP